MKIWALVKELEEKRSSDEKDLAFIKAALLVNYGPEPKGGSKLEIVDENDSTFTMLVKVLEKLEERGRGAFSTDYPAHQDMADCCGFFVPKSGSLICNECGININEAIGKLTDEAK